LVAGCISLVKNPDQLQAMASTLSSLTGKPAAEVIFEVMQGR